MTNNRKWDQPIKENVTNKRKCDQQKETGPTQIKKEHQSIKENGIDK